MNLICTVKTLGFFGSSFHTVSKCLYGLRFFSKLEIVVADIRKAHPRIEQFYLGYSTCFYDFGSFLARPPKQLIFLMSPKQFK